MSESTQHDELRARLERLIDDARKGGRLHEIEDLFRTLTAERAVATPTSSIPSRFGMVGDSPQMKAVFALLERVVASDVSVLVHGETGTGKELVAKALHQYGHRKDKPFLAENCAAVPPNLLESELFGHKKGSFTGASRSSCACCRTAKSAPWVRTPPEKSTCASSPRRTRISPPCASRARSGRTCTSAST
jgi:transcriptional regulator with GAF, ATPase, and Fis domain